MQDFIRKNKIRIRLSDTRQEKEHFHQDIELIYVLKGSLRLTVLERPFELRGEDVVVINANDRHCYEGSEGVLTAHLMIPYHMVRSVYSGLDSSFFCNSAVAAPPAMDTLRRTLHDMLLAQMVHDQSPETAEAVDYAFLAHYFRLLEILTGSFLFRASAGNQSGPEKAGKRMLLIDDYIQQNFDQQISLKSLSEHLYLSEGYLSRFFKKHFQVSFTDYLKGVRLAHALSELVYTDKPITKIAYDNGFSSVSFFNRVFKQEYGSTPSAIRESTEPRRLVAPDGENAPSLRQQLEEYMQAEDYATKAMQKGERPRFTCSAAQAQPLMPVWSEILNAGAASNLQDYALQTQIRALSDRLHFRYGRFWSPFSRDLHIGLSRAADTYNFRQLDRVTDFLLDAGLTPFVDLEEKIRRVNQTATTAKVYEPEEVAFENIEQWEALIRALLEHWIRRYGREKLSGWVIEVWYDGYPIGDNDPLTSFFLRYRSVYQIAKQLVPELRVGGSGVFPEFIRHERERKLHFWKEWVYRAPKPDFVSVMNYAYQGRKDGTDLYGEKSVDEQYLLHSLDRLREELNGVGWQGMPIFVTEWNRTVSDRNIMNDTAYQGAYVVRNMIETCGRAAMVGYFSGSDLLSHDYDASRLLNGGQGLLTPDGLLKPSAYAIGFLNALYPSVIGRDAHCIITSDGNGRYAVAAHNAKPLSSYYYLTDEDQIDREQLWKCFDDLSVLEMELRIEDVPNGDYYVKVRYLNEESGGVFGLWQEIGFQDTLDSEALEYFRELCRPHMLIRKHSVTDHCLTFPIVMQPNEIGIVRIDCTRSEES